ncbi:MAG: exodeoxyribonuclease VII small subunit [Rhodospirillaceae bacterium]|nr:exodeoxyribonuclease VII small subunit [Rhodospirillaceae bacterium]
MAEQPPIPDDVAAMSFEQALAGLETIVRRLDSGDVELDAAVGAFERGVLLKRHCEKKLSEARERVEQITQAPDGTLGVSPLPDME